MRIMSSSVGNWPLASILDPGLLVQSSVDVANGWFVAVHHLEYLEWLRRHTVACGIHVDVLAKQHTYHLVR